MPMVKVHTQMAMSYCDADGSLSDTLGIGPRVMALQKAETISYKLNPQSNHSVIVTA